ncbi:MAG: AlpA family transcriptional regulator [Alphaproteobacteria bacterium]
MTDITSTHISSKAHIIRLPEVISRVGLCRASIYKQMTKGSFPKPIAIGIRARGWLESEIDTWIALRVQTRETPQI